MTAEIAKLVNQLIRKKKVRNPNQIAFLFPFLKYEGKMAIQVERMKNVLEEVGLKVYAPRAGRFLEVEEAVDFFGVCLHIFGRPENDGFRGHDYAAYHQWLAEAYDVAADLMQADGRLRAFVADRKEEVRRAVADFAALSAIVEWNRWDRKGAYDVTTMRRKLNDTHGLSDQGRRALTGKYLNQVIERRIRERNPITLDYVIKRVTAIDWSMLDLFYRSVLSKRRQV